MATQSEDRGFFPDKNNEKIEYKLLSKKEELVIFNYLDSQFGIPSKAFNGYEFIKRGKDLWISTKKSTQALAFINSGLKINTIGLRALRNPFDDNKKATTNFIQIFGKQATKNLYQIKESDLLPYLRGEDLVLKENLERGYKIIKFGDEIVGVGICLDNRIKNQIPKSRFIKNWNLKSI